GVLVLIVILVFLQSWRALLVPATTVPVTIIGAFAFMPVMGFSVNLLTLFGLVLAIGIVVDDAIVIVENASHHIERGEGPREATIKAMNEVTGPIIAITLVLMAVFLPTAFLGGITGQLYRQFALTIAATAFISAINALSLKPAQCAVWLRPVTRGKGPFSRGFDYVYGRVERGYTWSIRQLLKVWWAVLLVFLGLALLTGWWYQRTPTGFLPTEDQGYIIIAIQLPDAASLDRTKELVERVNRVFQPDPKDPGSKMPGVDQWFVLGGFSLLDGTAAPNSATCFVAWTDWSKREPSLFNRHVPPGLLQEDLVKKIQGQLMEFPDAMVIVLVPPAIQGLGVAGGFEMRVEDREGVGLDELQERTMSIVDAARQNPQIDPRTATIFRSGVPQIY